MRKIEHPCPTFARTSAAKPHYVLPLARSLAVGASCAKVMRKIEHPCPTFARTSAAKSRYVLPLAKNLTVGASCAKRAQ